MADLSHQHKAMDITATPNAGGEKRFASPLTDDYPKKHRGDNDEDLRVNWDEGMVENQPRDQLLTLVGDSLKEKPKSVEEKIDRMLELYMTLDSKIHDANQISHNRLSELKVAHNKLVQRYESQGADLQETKSCVEDLKRDLSNMRIELDQTKNTMVDMITTIGMINTRVEYGEKTRIDLSTEIKEKKLILSGLPESKGEKIKETVLESIKTVLKKSSERQGQSDYKGPRFNTDPDSFDISRIDSTYRLGKYRKKYTRNIFVSFIRTEDRQLILRAKNTVDMQKDLNFYVNEDMSVDTRNHRATLKRISKAAIEAGYTAKVSGNKLIVGNNSYGKDELDILPSRVYKSCAQEKWVPNGLAFRGERSVFSNYYAKPFVVDKQKFLSMEQYIQYSKAIFGEDNNLARKILFTSDPSKLMALGERVDLSADDFDQWLELFPEILHKGAYAKFSQNSSLRSDLLATGDHLLFEATTDYYAGCGINLTSKKWEDSSWEGQNLTGRALVEVRDRLRLDLQEEDSISKCNASFASESQTSENHDEKEEYRIWRRKSRAHHHASVNCYAMLRKTRPLPVSMPRPRPCNDENVTRRSRARGPDLDDIPPLEGDETVDLSTTMGHQSVLNMSSATEV